MACAGPRELLQNLIDSIGVWAIKHKAYQGTNEKAFIKDVAAKGVARSGGNGFVAPKFDDGAAFDRTPTCVRAGAGKPRVIPRRSLEKLL